MDKNRTIEDKYEALARERQPYLDRAYDCAKLTIPTLINKDDTPYNNVYGKTIESPNQSTGALGSKSLASKLVLALFPPNEPMFKFDIDNYIYSEDQTMIDTEWYSKIQLALAKAEQVVHRFIEAEGDRPTLFEGLLHLIICGNFLFYDGKLKSAGGLEREPITGYPMDSYVIQRSPSGKHYLIITRDVVHKSELAPEIFNSLTKEDMDNASVHAGGEEEAEYIKVYTEIRRHKNKWKVRQEVGGKIITGSSASYRLDECPYIPVRMYSVVGEHYSRSYIELLKSDLNALDKLEVGTIEGAAFSAQMKFLVDPTGLTEIEDVEECPNGGYVPGRAQDVVAMQAQKQNDLAVVTAKTSQLRQTLSESMLLFSGATRDAERVTAEEIRALINQLDEIFGGVYATLSQEFQLPYLRWKLGKMRAQNKLPTFPDDVVEPVIVTGIAALGRGNDLTKLQGFLSDAVGLFGEQVYMYVKPLSALQELAASRGLDTSSLLKTQQELEEEQQQAQEQAQQEQALALAAQAAGEVPVQ